MIRFYVRLLPQHWRAERWKNAMITSTNSNIIIPFIQICSPFLWILHLFCSKSIGKKYHSTKQKKGNEKRRQKKTLFIRKYPLNLSWVRTRTTKNVHIYILILSKNCKDLLRLKWICLAYISLFFLCVCVCAQCFSINGFILHLSFAFIFSKKYSKDSFSKRISK